MNIAREAGELIATLMARPWGQVSASIYETGRLVALTPWLTGHQERVDYLLSRQREDGSWGGLDGYGLVPTLSATQALLATRVTKLSSPPLSVREDAPSVQGDAPPDVLTAAACRGLRVLRDWLPGPVELPDMPAVELIVPSLVALINEHGLGAPLPLPHGMDYASVERVRRIVASGVALPEKLLHALEVAGPVAGGAAAVTPTAIGTIGASPAATAAWLNGTTVDGHHSRVHLEAVATRYGGPVPVGLPITVFERGWVLSWLARAGVPVEVPPEMVADLRAAIGPAGAAAGPGLPADADTTSVALHALAMQGVPYEPESLLAFDAGTHFCTWQGEDGVSISVNAHVLDAFGAYASLRPDRAADYTPVMARLGAWLAGCQQPDGSWDDRWHASQFYATLSCVLALSGYGGPDHADTVDRAREWVLRTQRRDGSWGRWEGTSEETAYAVQTLLSSTNVLDPRSAHAARRGCAYLQRTGDMSEYPPLWHDKDLYTPIAVVRAAILAALQLGRIML